MGNPFIGEDDSTKKTGVSEATNEMGQVSLTFANGNYDDAQHVYLFPEGIVFREVSGTEVKIPVASGTKVDLLSPGDGLTTTLLSNGELLAGSYNLLTILVNSAKPIMVVKADG